MKQLQNWFKVNFGYSRKEINGVLVLLVFIFIAFSLSFVYDHWLYSQSIPVSEKELQELDQWTANIKWKKRKAEEESEGRNMKLTNLMTFDANTVSEEQLLAMRLPQRVARNWSTFLSRGGRFYEKADVLRVYGLDSAIYNQLAPFMVVAAVESARKRTPAKSGDAANKAEARAKLDINVASAADLEEVYGIGPAFSERIIKYRTILGGFYNEEQLSAVYGIKPETLDRLWERFYVDSATCCSRISLNTATIDSLRRHPYLNRNQAAAIVSYRNQHGPYTSWEELAEIKILPDSLIGRMRKYFKF